MASAGDDDLQGWVMIHKIKAMYDDGRGSSIRAGMAALCDLGSPQCFDRDGRESWHARGIDDTP
ncbi:hypothetical protein THIOKS13330049 [Thiocapsa sp. KS1]|nr:hypothetical protein THIOKS13330049 [Thiocapsa sp. KS1]